MSRGLRFLFLTTFYPPTSFGGDAIQVQRLAHVLAEKGHSVEVAYLPEAFRLLGGGRVMPPTLGIKRGRPLASASRPTRGDRS